MAAFRRFFMQYFTKGWLKSACFPALLFFALNITGCGTSDDVSGPPGVVNAGIYNSPAVEGAYDLEFVVSLAEASMAAVSMDYATADATAVAGTDYSTTSGTLQFAPGEVRKFIPVSVLNNLSLTAATGVRTPCAARFFLRAIFSKSCQPGGCTCV
jgi:hypothetical protein